MSGSFNFKDFDLIAGEKLYVDRTSIKFVDTILSEVYDLGSSDYSTLPFLNDFFFIPTRLLFVDNLLLFPRYDYTEKLYILDTLIKIEKFYGAGRFGNLVVVFAKDNEGNKLYLHDGETIEIQPVNLDVQLFKQLNQFSFALTYNHDKNSIIALYDLTALEGFNNATPFTTAIFPKSYNHRLVKENENYIFTTDDYTVYFSLVLEPFPVIKTEQVFNYRLNAYELLPFHSKLMKNSEIITDIDNGYILKSLDTGGYMFITPDLVLYGKNYIPLDRKHFLYKEVVYEGDKFYAVLKVYKIGNLINPFDTSTRLFQVKQHFGKPVFVEGLDLDFNYVSYLNGNLHLVVDTAYNGLVKSFRYKINPDKSYYKLGLKCDKIVINLISDTGAEFNGQLVFRDIQRGR